MASYTLTEALDLILDSSDGDESDIQEDPGFPLPRIDESGEESEQDIDESDEEGRVSEEGDTLPLKNNQRVNRMQVDQKISKGV